MFALVAPITGQSVNRHPQGAALLFVECLTSEPMSANRVKLSEKEHENRATNK